MGSGAVEVRWARAGRYQIAYTVTGDGPVDIVFIPNWFSNCELAWEYPSYERFLRRLASFSRLIIVDRRGMGLSDPLGLDEVPSIDDRADDVLAVLDAVGSDRVVVMGNGVGAYLPLYLAATHPTRVEGLVVLDGTCRVRRGDDYPIGMPAAAHDRLILRRAGAWGTVSEVADHRSAADNEYSAKYQRQSVPRGRVEQEMRFHFELDLRDLLPAIHVPALVVHHRENPQVWASHGRYLAQHIAAARHVELDGPVFFWADDGDRVMDNVEEFITGARGSSHDDFMLATVLYTDIVDSTAHAAAAGDRPWGSLWEAHEQAVRRLLALFGGREIKTLGDGFLATFASTQRAILCAHEIVETANQAGIAVRAGLHTGEIELRGSDIAGIAVNIASRVLGYAEGGEVVVSQTVKDLVLGAPLEFEPLGEHVLKGVPGSWRLWRLRST